MEGAGKVEKKICQGGKPRKIVIFSQGYRPGQNRFGVPSEDFLASKKSRTKRVKNNMSMEVENDVVAPRISKQKECCLGGNHSKTLRSFDGELVLPRMNTSKFICESHRRENYELQMVFDFLQLCPP